MMMENEGKEDVLLKPGFIYVVADPENL